jgi:hypothetical protein
MASIYLLGFDLLVLTLGSRLSSRLNAPTWHLQLAPAKLAKALRLKKRQKLQIIDVNWRMPQQYFKVVLLLDACLVILIDKCHPEEFDLKRQRCCNDTPGHWLIAPSWGFGNVSDARCSSPASSRHPFRSRLRVSPRMLGQGQGYNKNPDWTRVRRHSDDPAV